MKKGITEILDEYGFLWDLGYELRDGRHDRDCPFEIKFINRASDRMVALAIQDRFEESSCLFERTVDVFNVKSLFRRFSCEQFSAIDLSVFAKKSETYDIAKKELTTFHVQKNILKNYYADEILGKRWFSPEFLSSIPRNNFPTIFWIGKKNWFYEGRPVQLTTEQVRAIRASCPMIPPQSELTPELFEKYRRKLTPGINDYKTARLLYESVFDSFEFLRILNWSGYIVGRMWAREDALYLRFQGPKRKVFIDFRWDGRLKFKIRQSTGIPFVRRVCRFKKMLHQDSQFTRDSMSSIPGGVALVGRICQERLAEELKKERVKSI